MLISSGEVRTAEEEVYRNITPAEIHIINCFLLAFQKSARQLDGNSLCLYLYHHYLSLSL